MWAPSRKVGGIPRVSTRFSPSVENEQADTGRDGRIRLARPNFEARTESMKKSYFPVSVQLTTSRIGNHIWSIHTLLNVLTIQPRSYNNEM